MAIVAYFCKVPKNATSEEIAKCAEETMFMIGCCSDMLSFKSKTKNKLMSIQNILDKYLSVNCIYVNPYWHTSKLGYSYWTYEEVITVTPINKKKFTIIDYLVWIPLCKLHYGITNKYEITTKSLEETGLTHEQCKRILRPIRRD